MTLHTDEEVALANDMQKNAVRLTRLALAGDEIGLMNELELMVTNAISSRRARPSEPRRRAVRGYEKPSLRQPVPRPGVRYRESVTFDDTLLEVVDSRTVNAVASVIAHEGDRAEKSRLQIASRMINSHPNAKAYIQTFTSAINMIKSKLGIHETRNISDIMLELHQRLNEADDDKVGTSEPSKDRDTGEVLYHLDMSTRHLDVLVDYTLIAGHEKDIVAISSAIQKLAQVLRAEIESTRTPLDQQ